MARALQALEEQGFVVVHDALPAHVRQNFLSLIALQKLEHKCKELNEGRRVHCCMMRDRNRGWMEQQAVRITHLVDRFMAGRPYFTSQLQLLEPSPGTGPQFFHVDNKHRGITVIVYLVDVTLENGPTELLPRSHKGVACGSAALRCSAVLRCAPLCAVLR
jgi:hypothetical protein